MIGRVLAGTWTQPSIEDEGAWGGVNPDGSFYTTDGPSAQEAAYLRIGAVFSCVNFLADTMGQLEYHLFERLPDDGGKQRVDPNRNQLAELLHDQPNEDQTAFEFRFQMQAWASVRQNAIAEITWDRGQPTALTPRHPDRIRVERLPNGRKRYQYREDDGRERPILADNVFRLPGKPVLDYARESFALARSIQGQATRSFTRGIRPAGFIAQDPAVSYTPAARKRIKDRIMEEHGSSEKAGGILWLPEGLKWNQLGMTQEQAETVALVTASIKDIGRYFNIPPYRLGILESGTVSYASVEMQSVELVVYTMMPWVQRWEQATRRDLIVRKDTYFAEFLLQSLLRGTTKDRYDAYAVAIQWGWMSVNDVRRLENLNPLKGGDVYLRPLNMTPSADSSAGRLLRLLVNDTAASVVRKETMAMLRAAEKHRDDPAAWEQAVRTFYDNHGDHVAAKLHMEPGPALAYARRQRDALLADGPEVIPTWQDDGLADDLVALALPEAA
jgi:HK97 family phage portal protein